MRGPSIQRADVKSQSFSLRKGTRNDSTIFAIGEEKISLLANHPIKSLGIHGEQVGRDRQYIYSQMAGSAAMPVEE